MKIKMTHSNFKLGLGKFYRIFENFISRDFSIVDWVIGKYNFGKSGIPWYSESELLTLWNDLWLAEAEIFQRP